MTLPVIIIGGGGHAKVLVSTLLFLGREIIGFTEADEQKQGQNLAGVPIIGNDDTILQYKPDQIELINGIGSVNLPVKRMEIYNRYKGLGYKFASVVHPSALLEKDTKISEGVQIMAGAIVQTGCTIGENTIINTGAILDHDCIIGAHVHIAPGVTLSGGVHIDSMSHIGTSATIIQGIKIGKNCLIGAGSIVVKDIPSGSKIVGVPAREI